MLGVLQQVKYICAVLPKLSGIMVPLRNKIVFYLDVNSLIIVNIGSQSLITGKERSRLEKRENNNHGENA